MEKTKCTFCQSMVDYISTIDNKDYYVCPRCGKVIELENPNYWDKIQLFDIPEKPLDPSI